MLNTVRVNVTTPSRKCQMGGIGCFWDHHVLPHNGFTGDYVRKWGLGLYSQTMQVCTNYSNMCATKLTEARSHDEMIS